MSVSVKPLNQIARQAITLLSKELGRADTVRFLRRFSAGFRSYAEEREVLFNDLTLEEMLSELRGTPWGP